MRQSSGNGRWVLQALGGIGVSLLIAAACAGGDTPQRTTSLEAAIINRYDPGYPTGNAGSASMAGGGGSGQGGSGSGQGGSASTAGSGAGSSTAGSGSGMAGSGSGMAGSGSSGDVCNAPVQVLMPSCGALGGSCHGAGSPFGNFGESEAAAQALVGEASNCGGLQYFNTGNPQQSAVVQKLEDSPPCGSPMPLGDDALPQGDVDCIIEWIGAQ